MGNCEVAYCCLRRTHHRLIALCHQWAGHVVSIASSPFEQAPLKRKLTCSFSMVRTLAVGSASGCVFGRSNRVICKDWLKLVVIPG